MNRVHPAAIRRPGESHCLSADHRDGPWVVCVAGMGGVGKTTVASSLASRLGLRHVEVDTWSIRLYGSRRAVNDAPDRTQRYDRVYAHAHAEAARHLSQGRSVVTDGSYVNPARRTDLLERCAAMNVSVGIVLLDDEHGARVRNRSRTGDALLPESELDGLQVERVRAARRAIEDELWSMRLVCEWVDGARWRVLGEDAWGLAALLLDVLPREGRVAHRGLAMHEEVKAMPDDKEL